MMLLIRLWVVLMSFVQTGIRSMLVGVLLFARKTLSFQDRWVSGRRTDQRLQQYFTSRTFKDTYKIVLGESFRQ